LNEIIRKRKSIRKYDSTKLDNNILEEVKNQIEKVTPLYPDIKYSIEIVDKAKRAFGINAPHYLVLRSEKKEGMYENIGFIGQQLDLYFSANGLGSCWVGMAKPESNPKDSLQYVICISFGKPAEPLHRNLSSFKRKSLESISEGSDPRLEGARLAPSGINAQGWYFIAEGGKIHSYYKRLSPLLGKMMSNLAPIDLGIALYHIASESESFGFVKESHLPEVKGYQYAGTVVS